MYKRQIADRIAGSIFVMMGIVCLVEGWRMFPMRTRGIVGDEAFPLPGAVAVLCLPAGIADVQPF